MKGRAIIPLVVGLGIGLMALKVFVGVLQKAKGNTGQTVPVVCAAVDLEPTTEIRESMVETQEVPRALVPQLAFNDKKEVVGRVTSLVVPKGMPVIPRHLAPKGTPAGMAALIREGYRAVAVTIDESAGVAGWIRPGSRVDVAVQIAKNTLGKTEQISKVVLQNVEVLAVGQDMGSTVDSAASLVRSVTLSVHPDDVSRLHLAATVGKLRLAMRNQLDNGQNATPLTTDNDLLAFGFESRGRQKKPVSFWGSLFGGQPLQNKDQETDNTNGGVPRAEPAFAPQVQEPWSIEVVKGPQGTEMLWFEDGSRSAKRVRGQQNKGQTVATNRGAVTTAVKPALNPSQMVMKKSAQIMTEFME